MEEFTAVHVAGDCIKLFSEAHGERGCGASLRLFVSWRFSCKSSLQLLLRLRALR